MDYRKKREKYKKRRKTNQNLNKCILKQSSWKCSRESLKFELQMTNVRRMLFDL